MIEKLQKHYGQLFEPKLLAEIDQTGIFKEVPKGSALMDIGQYVKGMPLLISGVIKVLRQDKDGDELLLYFLEKGDTCAMTMSCCMGHTKSEIRAIAETDTTLIMVPVQKMEEWTSRYKTWRKFVFESYHNRLMEVLETIDSIAFYNMDERLLKYLKEKVKVTQSNSIQNTHQQIAYDLNTSRVVVSRLLKKLEKMNVVELSRNSIKVISE
jgi:CRP/FNR family transcriptional regulator